MVGEYRFSLTGDHSFKNGCFPIKIQYLTNTLERILFSSVVTKLAFGAGGHLFESCPDIIFLPFIYLFLFYGLFWLHQEDNFCGNFFFLLCALALDIFFFFVCVCYEDVFLTEQFLPPAIVSIEFSREWNFKVIFPLSNSDRDHLDGFSDLCAEALIAI